MAKASIERVVAAADMLEVVGQYTQLKKAGANYMGRCPFHEEKTPSFSVDPAEKLYYCFGCGEGGDLLTFVEKKENLEFAAAVEALADRFGVQLDYEETSGRADADRKRRERLLKLLELTCAYYERVLWEARAASAARAYLSARGLAEPVCREYRLGFSLPGWSNLRDAAAKKGFSERELTDAGLVVPGKKGGVYDRFRGRLMFPLADERGRVLGFGARTLGDDKPKYLNSPETPLYHKSEALFGLDRAKASAARLDRLFVVEGYTDVVALVQAGVTNVVASMGTAFTEEQLRRLTRHTRNLFLCFDADAAGLGAMNRALELARRLGATMRVVRVPDGLDPADYVLGGHDGEAFTTLAAQAQTLLQFQIRTVLASHDLQTVDGRTRAFAVLRGILAKAASPLERDEEVRYVADRLQLSEENVRFLLSDDAASAGARRAALMGGAASEARQRPSARRSAEERVLMGTHELEVSFLAACLALPDPGREYLLAIDEGFFSSEASRGAYRAVVERLGPKPAGKTDEGHGKVRDGGVADDGTVAAIVLRAAAESFTPIVLQELFLRVQEGQVARRIAKLKAAMGRDDSEDETRLIELEGTRREIREQLRALPVEG
ncbi:MAG: DNA primase [Thermoleophilia bacterium]